MKKSKLIGLGLCVVMLTAALTGCANGADSSSSGDSSTPAAAPASGTPSGGTGGTGGGGSGGGNGGSGGGSTGANQTAIDEAAVGASITLSGTDTQLSITRGITINGNGLSGATITVSPSVARNVTLRNFTNSNIRVANVSSGGNSSVNTVNNGVFSSVRSVFGGIFRSDSSTPQSGSGTTEEKFNKIGDGSVPLYLENCTGVNFEAEGKVALYLEKGENKKSDFTEIKLKAGAEDFSFIEFDENGKEVADKTATPTTDKSKVGNLKIEDNGVSKVNLIGGTFDNVSFGSGVTSGIELKYDEEFDDQLNFSGKETLLADTNKITAKENVAIAKHASSSGVYKFTMTRQEFELYNGNITIIFITATQKQTVSNKHGRFTYWTPNDTDPNKVLETCATYANPVYAAIPAGHFKVNDLTTTGYKTVQGAEFAYGDYAHATANGHPNWLEKEDIVVLSHYRNYNKEAFVINLGETTVDIYVNTAAIKKNDLVVCIGSAGQSQPKAEYCSKASDLDLSNYTPYLAINRNYEGYTGGIGDNDEVILNSITADIGTVWDLPYAQVLKMTNNEVRYALFTMQPDTYPTEAAGLTYPNIEVPAGKHHPFESYLNDPDPGRL